MKNQLCCLARTVVFSPSRLVPKLVHTLTGDLVRLVTPVLPTLETYLPYKTSPLLLISSGSTLG